MRRALLVFAAAAVLSIPSRSPAQTAPVGFASNISLGAGGEMGLKAGEGKAGITELEASLGYEFESIGLRPEVAIALGLKPDTNAAVRPGIRWSAPGLPFQLRAALDASNARDRPMRWRWLLLGVAGEIRFTTVLGLFAELDSGAPLSSAAGVPLLIRGGAVFRF
jgi:hypothetical protein